MSENYQDIFEYVFTWISYIDAKSCRYCVALNGREYHGQDLFAPVLVDPEFGPIWDLDANRSLMHGGSGTCRCMLVVRVENIKFEDVEGFAKLNQFLETHK